MKVRQYLYFTLIFSLLQLCATVAPAQTASGTLHGQVSDPSGAAIPNASVVLTPASAGSAPIKAQANGQQVNHEEDLYRQQPARQEEAADAMMVVLETRTETLDVQTH